MIRIERVTLPPGLRALARRDSRGDLVIYVSAQLDSRQQRAAVLEAVRASRRAGWRAALPIWIAAAAGIRFWLRRVQHAIRTQPAAWATGVGAVVAGAVLAAVFLAAPGGGHSPLAIGGTPGSTPSSQVGSGQPGGHGGHGKRHVQPISVVPPGSGSRSPQPGQSSPGSGSTSPAPGHSHSVPPSSSPPPGHSPTPTPHPSGSSSPTIPPSHTPTPKPTHTSTPKPTPTPTPTPKPSPKKSKHCVIILGIKVCVGL